MSACLSANARGSRVRWPAVEVTLGCEGFTTRGVIVRERNYLDVRLCRDTGMGTGRHELPLTARPCFPCRCTRTIDGRR